MANDFKGGRIAVPETKRVKFRVGQNLKSVVAKS
jgi:nucleoid DNA-binding protein